MSRSAILSRIRKRSPIFSGLLPLVGLAPGCDSGRPAFVSSTAGQDGATVTDEPKKQSPTEASEIATVDSRAILGNIFAPYAAQAAFPRASLQPCSADEDCKSQCPTLLVASGYDWAPLPLVVLEPSDHPTRGCAVEAHDQQHRTWKALAQAPPAYYVDVEAADVDGDGRDEFVVAALADGERHKLGSGFISLVEVDANDASSWSSRVLVDEVSPTDIALTDVDGDGILDVAMAIPIDHTNGCRPTKTLKSLGRDLISSDLDLSGLLSRLRAEPRDPPPFNGALPFYGLGDARPALVDLSFVERHSEHLSAERLVDPGDTQVTNMGKCFVDGFAQVLLGQITENNYKLAQTPPERLGSHAAFSITAGDFNGDGRIDLMTGGGNLTAYMRTAADASWVAIPGNTSGLQGVKKNGYHFTRVTSAILPNAGVTKKGLVGPYSHRTLIAAAHSCWSECTPANIANEPGIERYVRVLECDGRVAKGDPLCTAVGEPSAEYGIIGAVHLRPSASESEYDLLYGTLTRCSDNMCKCLGNDGTELEAPSMSAEGICFPRGTGYLGGSLRTRAPASKDAPAKKWTLRGARPMVHDIVEVPDPRESTRTVEVSISDARDFLAVRPGRNEVLVSAWDDRGSLPVVAGANLVYLGGEAPPAPRRVVLTFTASDWFVASGSWFALDGSGSSHYFETIDD